MKTPIKTKDEIEFADACKKYLLARSAAVEGEPFLTHNFTALDSARVDAGIIVRAVAGDLHEDKAIGEIVGQTKGADNGS